MAGLRYFVVLDSDELVPVSMAKVNQLWRSESARERGETGPLPEYAAQRLRYAMVFYDTENRRPTKVRATEFGIWVIDKRGHLDQEFRQQVVCRAMASLDRSQRRDGHRDDRAKFTKRWQDEFKWKPSDAVLTKLRERLFK